MTPDAHARDNFVIHAGGRAIDVRSRTYVMGVLNVTPDSFSDGGLFAKTEAAVARGVEMEAEGADLIDVGGESTRPGSDPVPANEEIRRVVPVIKELSRRTNAVICIDTSKATVAEAAVGAGATVINDVTALAGDPGMGDFAARCGVPVILMHMKGAPKTMQVNPVYGDVVREVKEFLATRILAAEAMGIREIVIDPGIGFGKSLKDNLTLMNRLDVLTQLGRPVLVGPSRKSFIGMILDTAVNDRVEGTAAAVALSIVRGANIVRVHDVRQISRVVQIADSILQERNAAESAAIRRGGA